MADVKLGVLQQGSTELAYMRESDGSADTALLVGVKSLDTNLTLTDGLASRTLSQLRLRLGDQTFDQTGLTAGHTIRWSGSQYVVGLLPRSSVALGSANHVLVNDGSGGLSSEAQLAVSRGGTNSGATLSNNRVMVSLSGAIVEHSALTTGQVVFPGATGLPSGSASFLWDNTNTRLGIGVTPTERLHVSGGNVLFGTSAVVSHRAVAGITWQEQQATVSTTDATVTTLDSFTVPTDTSSYVEFRVVGRRTGGSSGTVGDSSVFGLTARVRNVGGTVTVLDLQNDYTSEANTATSATLDVSGTSVRLRVAGAASNNYSWWSHAKILNG